MKNGFYLKPFQEKFIDIFMGMYGIDAGIEVLAIFEKTGSLGDAMIEYCHKTKQETKCEKRK